MRRCIVPLAIVLGLLVASCSPSTSPIATPVDGPLATSHLSVNGIELDYPAEWTVNDQRWPGSTGMGQVFAIVGTLPWGPCAPADINCHYEQRLDPGQISVEIGTLSLAGDDICHRGTTRSDLAGRGPDDPPATGSLMRVDGRPTLRTDYTVDQLDYYHSDEWRSWLIAAPGSIRSGYTIDARYRGPGLETMRTQLDELVASVRLVPVQDADQAGPADCGPPFPV